MEGRVRREPIKGRAVIAPEDRDDDGVRVRLLRLNRSLAVGLTTGRVGLVAVKVPGARDCADGCLMVRSTEIVRVGVGVGTVRDGLGTVLITERLDASGF